MQGASYLFFPALWGAGGALSFIVAVVAAFFILRGGESFDRPWIKAALVFLVLGPLAFWGLQMPASAEAIAGGAMYGRAMDDIFQSQLAIIAVAVAATFCAARAMTAMLDDLAV